MGSRHSKAVVEVPYDYIEMPSISVPGPFAYDCVSPHTFPSGMYGPPYVWNQYRHKTPVVIHIRQKAKLPKSKTYKARLNKFNPCYDTPFYGYPTTPRPFVPPMFPRLRALMPPPPPLMPRPPFLPYEQFPRFFTPLYDYYYRPPLRPIAASNLQPSVLCTSCSNSSPYMPVMGSYYDCPTTEHLNSRNCLDSSSVMLPLPNCSPAEQYHKSLSDTRVCTPLYPNPVKRDSDASSVSNEYFHGFPSEHPDKIPYMSPTKTYTLGDSPDLNYSLDQHEFRLPPRNSMYNDKDLAGSIYNIENLKNEFYNISKGKGVIDYNDFRAFMPHVYGLESYNSLKDTILQNIFDEFDLNKDGYISFDEFIQAYKSLTGRV